MIKYFKYYIPSIFLFSAIYVSTLGIYYPTIFLICFSLTVIIGDIILPRQKDQNFSFPFILNLSIYINLPLLFILVFLIIAVFSSYTPNWFLNIYKNYFFIDILSFKDSITLFDKVCLIGTTSLFMGILGTVPGHELTHRKKNKFDMFIGNWMLAFSWDCAFAVEHVYGHHKNVCLPEDPATTKRGENIYKFIFKATIKEQSDAWKIELSRLRRRGYPFFSIQNKMLIGYLRSALITFLAMVIGGGEGIFWYLVCAFFSKSLLEVINYSEHYGLVREKGKPVYSRHSWNSNHTISSILLCNVTRHSSHHETASLKFWELKTYPDAPMLPQGYLAMIYISIFLPFLYHKIMEKKLIDWDLNYATDMERNIVKLQNKVYG